MKQPKFLLVLFLLLVAGAGGRFLFGPDGDGTLRALGRAGELDRHLETTAAGETTAPAPVPVIDLFAAPSPELADELAELDQGDRIDVRLDEREVFRYVVDLRHETGPTVELRGHLLSDPDRLIVLGLRPDGASGFMELPDGRVHALGYADGTQVAGRAGDDWMADRLAAGAILPRAPTAGEEAPVAGAQPVTVDLPALAALSAGEQIAMQLPGIGVARVTMDRLDVDADSTTWVGHLTDFGDSYPVLITYSDEAVEGSALTPLGEVVLTAGHVYSPQQLGLVNAKREGENCAAAAGSIRTAAAATAGTAGAPVSAQAVATANTLDVLVYYSPDMEALYGSAGAVATRVDALFAAANQAYGAAKLGYTLRRVGLKKVGIPETLSNDDALSRLQTGTAEFASAAADRNAAGADLATLIRPLRTAQHKSCGVGYVGGYGGGSIAAYANHMVSVVSDGKDRNGTNTYCDTMTLAHETGHNLGLMHDRATVASQGGGSGVKPYAFGYAVANTWGTIMSYTSPVQYRFSDPDDSTCPGTKPCGVVASAANSADNALALAHSLPIVAGFRQAAQTQTPLYTISGIVSLDGKAVAGATLTPSIGGITCGASGSTGRYSCQAPAGSSFTLTPSISLGSGVKATWTPANAKFTALAANATANFSGKRVSTTYTLSGRILLDGKPVQGGKLKVSGSGVTCGATDAAGAFSCKASPGASVTLAPDIVAKAGTRITWTPASRAFAKIAGQSTTADFSGQTASLNRSISGTVRVQANGVIRPVAGATLKPSVAGVSCGKTNAAGAFTCTTAKTVAFSLQPTYAVTGHTFKWMPASLPATGNVNVSFSGTAVCPRTGCKF